MSRNASFTSVALALIVLASCHSRSQVQQPAPQRPFGTYEFTLRGAEGSTFQGLVHFLGDTIQIDPREGTCRVDPTWATPLSMRYLCEGLPGVTDLKLSFDRRNPVNSSYWSGMVQKMVTRTICERYGTDAQGRTVCVASHTQTEEQSVQGGGSLLVQAKVRAP